MKKIFKNYVEFASSHCSFSDLERRIMGADKTPYDTVAKAAVILFVNCKEKERSKR